MRFVRARNLWWAQAFRQPGTPDTAGTDDGGVAGEVSASRVTPRRERLDERGVTRAGKTMGILPPGDPAAGRGTGTITLSE